MKSALIVIDVQQSFTRRPYWQENDVQAFLANLQTIVDASVARQMPVVQIFHRSEGEDASDPFSLASGLVRTLDGLRITPNATPNTTPDATPNTTPNAVFFKTVHSSMFGKNAQGQTLDDWLRAQGIGELIITGIRTEQCCETTTRHASDLGYTVRFATDATLTFPMQHAGGKRFSAQEIRERTELVLAGRFAKIVSASAAFA